MTEKLGFAEYMNKLSEKIGNNIYLQSISKGVMPDLPIIIIGSFASLAVGLPVAFWQSFLQSTGLAAILSMIVAGTTNMLGVYFTFSITRAFAEKMGIEAKLVPILALVVYFALMPSQVLENNTISYTFTYLGTRGMIVGIVIAICTVKLFKKVVDANIVIKMPEGTPDYVSNSFISLIPGFMTSLTSPIMFGLDGMNQAAYSAGQPIPSVIGMAFSYSMTIAVVYPAFAVAVMLFSKSSQLKTVSKIALAPAFFGISEPLIFGMPVVLNPMIAIPWIITPILNFVLGYAACSIGLVARYAGVTVFNFPMVSTGILNGSLSIAIMEIVIFVIDVLVYMPFVKMQDKKYLNEERAAAQTE